MAIFPSWSTLAASAGAGGATWANVLISNIVGAEKVITSVARAQPSLRTYMRLTLRTDGSLISSTALAHDTLGGVSSNQHHVRTHGNTHIGSDLITLANASQAGLISSTLTQKLNVIQSSATRNRVKADNYVGNGATSFVTIGFMPSVVKIIEASTAKNMIDFIKGANWIFEHRTTTYVHLETSATNTILLATTLMRVKGKANYSGKTYFYLGME